MPRPWDAEIGVDLLPAEAVELEAIELALVVVGLVDRDDHRRRGRAQEVGRLLVGRGHAADGIDHEHDDVGLTDGQAGLLLDVRLDRVVRIDLEAAGVDDDESPAVPLGVAVQPVTGRPGTVLDDRRARTEDPVEERALADVRATDDGHDRQRATEARGGTRRPRSSRHGGAASGRAGGRASDDVGQRGGPTGWRRRRCPTRRAASSAACAWASGVPAISRIRWATSRRSSIGVEVPPVTPTTCASPNTDGVGQVARRSRSGWRACRRSRTGGSVPSCSRSIDHRRRPSCRRPQRLHRVLLATDRDRADGVDDLQLVGARDHERRQAFELPGRLGRLADEGHPLLARDGLIPLLFLVDDDRVRGEAQQPDDLGVLGRAEQARSCSPPRRAGRVPSAPGSPRCRCRR